MALFIVFPLDLRVDGRNRVYRDSAMVETVGYSVRSSRVMSRGKQQRGTLLFFSEFRYKDYDLERAPR